MIYRYKRQTSSSRAVEWTNGEVLEKMAEKLSPWKSIRKTRKEFAKTHGGLLRLIMVQVCWEGEKSHIEEDGDRNVHDKIAMMAARMHEIRTTEN